MCFWSSGGSSGGSTTYQSTATESATEEKESAAKKARLVGTSGGNKGAELASAQGQSVRRIFG